MNDSEAYSKIVLAKWTDRLLAWLIDFIIISIISTSIIFAVFETIDYDEDAIWEENIQYIPTSLSFFIYYIILEHKTGQTIGKKILNLKVTNISGSNPSLKGVIISSFGKTFLLPIDMLLGLILTNEKRQRIFNKLGDTLVVKIKISDDTSNISYSKD